MARPTEFTRGELTAYITGPVLAVPALLGVLDDRLGLPLGVRVSLAAVAVIAPYALMGGAILHANRRLAQAAK